MLCAALFCVKRMKARMRNENVLEMLSISQVHKEGPRYKEGVPGFDGETRHYGKIPKPTPSKI